MKESESIAITTIVLSLGAIIISLIALNNTMDTHKVTSKKYVQKLESNYQYISPIAFVVKDGNEGYALIKIVSGSITKQDEVTIRQLTRIALANVFDLTDIHSIERVIKKALTKYGYKVISVTVYVKFIAHEFNQ